MNNRNNSYSTKHQLPPSEQDIESNTISPMNSNDSQSGGFIRPSIFSPAPSSLASSTANVHLPRTRTKPLPSGSAKESSFIRHLDERIQRIQRRYAKRGTTASSEPDNPANPPGYHSFAEVARDVEELVELVWISATREFCLQNLVCPH